MTCITCRGKVLFKGNWCRSCYIKLQNKRRKNYKRLWAWNKRHPLDQKPMPPKKELGRPKRVIGNEKWQELTKEDREWRKAHK